jgi:regulator of protease activity HflC (stomatin/prohibitin superfamily)
VFGLEFLGFLVAAYVLSSLKVVKEYDRLVVFTLGKVTGTAGPGVQFVFPFLDKKASHSNP